MMMNVKKVKIIVMIPPENTNEVRDAIWQAGAGNIGNYSSCSTTMKVEGTFRPNKEANPYIGEKETLEIVEEDRLEVICEIEKAKKVISTIRKTHPYEEPEIDIIPLLDETSLSEPKTIKI